MSILADKIRQQSENHNWTVSPHTVSHHDLFWYWQTLHKLVLYNRCVWCQCTKENTENTKSNENNSDRLSPTSCLPASTPQQPQQPLPWNNAERRPFTSIFTHTHIKHPTLTHCILIAPSLDKEHCVCNLFTRTIADPNPAKHPLALACVRSQHCFSLVVDNKQGGYRVHSEGAEIPFCHVVIIISATFEA